MESGRGGMRVPSGSRVEVCKDYMLDTRFAIRARRHYLGFLVCIIGNFLV